MKHFEKTLLEQLQISDVEIQHRMALLVLNREHLSVLANNKTIIENNIEAIVDQFLKSRPKLTKLLY